MLHTFMFFIRRIHVFVIHAILLSILGLVFLFSSSTAASAQETKSKEQLEQELNALNKEITQHQADLIKKQGESASLSRDIGVLDTKIKKSQAEIKAHNLNIQRLSTNIAEKTEAITELNQSIDKQKNFLQSALREMHYTPQGTLALMALSDNTISKMLDSVQKFNDIQGSLNRSIDSVKSTKHQLEGVKTELEENKGKEETEKLKQQAAEKAVQSDKQEKNTLLTRTKGQEKEYQTIIKEKEAQAAKIRSALFELAGGGKDINFGQAYDIAKSVQNITSVDPAFLLAIITQESNLGKNVGQCYVTDLTTGDGKGINTGTPYEKVMGEGSLPYFERITSGVGRNWSTTPVSCPIDIKGVGTATKYYQGRGYGGAMGPAQFIPSTWRLFETHLTSILGRNPDPWNPNDAFLASATYLSELGAVAGNAASEHRAACKYYGTGGATCSYSNSVMRIKATVQGNIDALNY